MEEIKETLEQVWERLDNAETCDQIVAGLNFSATGGHLSAADQEAAAVIHAELLKRLETVADSESRLAVARAARSHYRQIAAENTRKYCEDQIENHWERWRALRHYQSYPADRPVNSRYSLEEVAAYHEAPKVVQQGAPGVEGEL